MKVVIGIAAAAVLAVVSFFGVRGVLSDDGAGDAAASAVTLVEGTGAELADRLDAAGIEVEGAEAVSRGEWSLSIDAPPDPNPEGDSTGATVRVPGTATLTIPETVGDAARELLLYENEGEQPVPVDVEISLAKGEEGWEAESVALEDPFPRPAEPEQAELASVVDTTRAVAGSALSLLGPGRYEQPDVYATPVEASEQEQLDARAGNDKSYPPYLVEVPSSDLITGPVDRALVLAMGCEYETSDVEIVGADAADPMPDAGHLQVAETFGLARMRPTNISCRRGSPPRLPLDVAFVAQFARSRLSADSDWRVTRLTVEIDGGEPRDLYSVAAEVTGDERDPGEFGQDLVQTDGE